MTRPGRRKASVLIALLVVGCEAGDPIEPEDGGVPLDLQRLDAETEKIVSRDCMWRREKGGWHYSIGHCEPMLPPDKVQGVFVTAFEERSFFPGLTGIPDANDPARFTQDIEVDADKVARLSGHAPSHANGEAYLLTFVGRRTRNPWFDCYGVPSFSWVVDRLASARYLGSLKPFDRSGIRARYEGFATRFRGRWGEEQRKAVDACRARDSD